jgi:hypothetical protein
LFTVDEEHRLSVLNNIYGKYIFVRVRKQWDNEYSYESL